VGEETTHFGYQDVPVDGKSSRVRSVFDSVASRYDVMNDFMSFGLHRVWKRCAAALSGVRPGHRVLDLAGGTGDMARLLSRRAGTDGEVVLADINRSMLEQARRRLVDAGLGAQVSCVQADAERLPFPDGGFDCVCVAFGLRNMTHKDRALRSMFRVLRPGGRLLVLEFSTVVVPPLRPVYDLYSFGVLPRLGRIVAGDADSYRYLAESIRMHPDQEGLVDLMREAGFERCDYHNLTGGIAAVHRGVRL
jgi:demethylmenaquinone methyltransferase/2-methoxy-6-polyprenyl-1,4-benzoquinol methylase